MTEFKIKLDDRLVQTIGHDKIERYLNEYINQIILKFSAQDIIGDLDSIDLENDDKWKLARKQAWNEQKSHYYKKVD